MENKYCLSLVSDDIEQHEYRGETLEECYAEAYRAHATEIEGGDFSNWDTDMAHQDKIYSWWVLESPNDNRIDEYSWYEDRWCTEDDIFEIQKQRYSEDLKEQVKRLKSLLRECWEMMPDDMDGLLSEYENDLSNRIEEELSK